MLDVAPWQTWGTTTATLMPVLQAAHVDISFARLAAILGHSFTFSMAKGGGEVWQTANIDWGLAFGQLDLLPYELESFNAVLKGAAPAPSPETLAELKQRAWRAVIASVERGVPAIAWNARTLEQRDRGVPGAEWSCLVGYDAADKSYVVRSQFSPDPWSVPFDGFGYADPINWFCVVVLTKPKPVDAGAVTRRCLQQAVDYAHGTRFDIKNASYPVAALGFAAYELWKDAFERGDASSAVAPMHCAFLIWAREQASEYCREIGRAAATDAYAVEVEHLRKLDSVCREASSAGRFDTGSRYEAIRHLESALASDRRAIAAIESGLNA